LVSRGTLLLVAFITSDMGLLALAAVFWLMDGLPSPVYAAIIQSIYPIEHRGKVLAIVRLGISLPTLILAPVAGWMLDRLGYRVLFPIAGVFGILGALIFSRLKVNEALVLSRQTRMASSMGQILRSDRRFGVYLLSLVLFGLGSLVPSALVPLIQVDRLHLTYAHLGWLNLVLSLTRFLGYFYWGRRIDRLGGVQSLQIMFLINAVYLIPYLWASQGWMLVPSFIATGLVNAGIDLAFIAAVIQLADPRRVLEYAALQATVVGLRGIIGPFIGVGLLRLGLTQSAIFTIAIGLTLLAVLLLNQLRSASPVPVSDGGAT
jgi:MFS family permease